MIKMFRSNIIKDALLKYEPMFDFETAGTVDDVIYRACCDDLFNYLVYIKENNLAYDVDFLQAMSLNLFNKTLMDTDIDFHIDAEKVEEYTKEGAVFVDMFVKMWLKKYKQRVSVTFVKPNMPKEIGNGRNIFAVYYTVQERIELLEFICGIFIKHGELAFQKVLAENLIYIYLGRLDKPNKKWTIEEKLEAMGIIGREANRLVNVTGVLIFVTPKFARMFEWRDFGNGQKIV